MEMSSKQILNRMASSMSDIPLQRIKDGKMRDEDWPKYTKAMEELNAAELFIDEAPALSVMQMRSRARKLKRESNIELIIVDHLALIDATGTKINSNMHLIVSANTKALKAIAKELDVCVLCLCQLNRNVEHRSDKRPLMSDLRESGAIEEDADLIMFLYRDEVYNKDSDDKGIAELILSKNRDGEIGTGYLSAQLEKVRFKNHIGEIPSLSGSKNNQGFN